jgi:hypothetical protein
VRRGFRAGFDRRDSSLRDDPRGNPVSHGDTHERTFAHGGQVVDGVVAEVHEGVLSDGMRVDDNDSNGKDYLPNCQHVNGAHVQQ